MLDDSDIKKLKEVFGTKEETKEMLKGLTTENRIHEMLKGNNKTLVEEFSKIFATKADFDDFKQEYRQEFAKDLNPIDKKVGQDVDEAQEKTMLTNKVDRHEKWINKIAAKVDLKLES